MRARQRVERLQQQRRLADARVAADQHHAAGDDAAAQHAVELVDAGRDALELARLDLGERAPTGRRRAGMRWPAPRLGDRLAQRAGRAAARAGAEPLQRGGAALGADVGGLRLAPSG